MSGANLILPVLVPLAAGLLALVLPSREARRRLSPSMAPPTPALPGLVPGLIAIIASAAQVALAVFLFPRDASWSLPWLGFGIDLALKLSRMSAFILLAIAGFSLLVSLYATVSLGPSVKARQFFAWLLITVSLASGAALADNLVLLLVFWEGLLLTLFGMIATGAARPYGTAVKAFIIVGATDLAMMLGVMLTAKASGSLSMSAIHLPLDGIGGAAFLLLMVGAMGKAGAMPFHSWIPDAALDAPLPFMAILPAAIEKLLGIYFLARISLDLFTLTPDSWVSYVLMAAGAVTILFAVLMALVQKDYKRLLSYHAISQVGYMMLGIGTAVPIGIVGGLFHMVNHAMYKSCLFLTGGAVEKQAGTTDLSRLGGLGRRMPVTMIAFIVAAASISGVPPFNGFFSKEMVYDGALERGWVFYAAALLGSFFTAASFLKLGHAAFFGRANDEMKKVKEAPWPMLVPMIVLAGLCILFGVGNGIPLHGLVEPAVGQAVLAGESFAGFPHSVLLVVLTVVVLAAALINHAYGVRKTGRGIGAVDHIHNSAVLSPIYEVAEKGLIDPYTLGRYAVKGVARGLWGVDRAFDWVYEKLAAGAAFLLGGHLRRVHNGNPGRYLLWSLAGAAAVIIWAILLVGGAQ
jgi:formate hydrogenlyase subunit 3/multisubunit Na+/H+ antiporter MnhD subunit